VNLEMLLIPLSICAYIIQAMATDIDRSYFSIDDYEYDYYNEELTSTTPPLSPQHGQPENRNYINTDQSSDFCEQPFEMLGDECLFFYDGDMMIWQEAVDFCKIMGGFLAEVNEPEALLQYVNQTYFQSKTGFWLGATDQNQEGEWKWNSGLPISPSVWGVGQPNDWKGDNNNHQGQDCMEIILHDTHNVDQNGYIFIQDAHCDEKQFVICEK
ncbi:unnamed protein product, partial [Meganyctiphanes norvegica]